MLKKIVTGASLVAVALTSSLAVAADDARSSINITATIPTAQFHVIPRDPNFGKDEVMSYNLSSATLNPLRHTYDVKNTEGSINAYIEGGPADLFNGRDRIPLTTAFNGVTLGATPVEVVSDAASTPGTSADLTIAAAKPTGAQTGDYATTFAVVFDAVPRP